MSIREDLEKAVRYGNKKITEKGGISSATTVRGVLDSIDTIQPFYGVEWDSTVADSAVKRIGDLMLHRNLPIQSLMRKCLLKDDGTVNYYLDEKPKPNMITSNWTGGNAIVTVSDNVIRGQANTGVGQLGYVYNNLGPNITLNKQYQYSFYARANANVGQNLRIFDSALASRYVDKTINITTEWQLFTGIFTPFENAGTNSLFLRLVCGGSSTAPDTTSWVELRDVKLEQSPIRKRERDDNMITGSWSGANSTVSVTGGVIKGQSNAVTTGSPLTYTDMDNKITLNREYTISFYARVNADASRRMRIFELNRGSYIDKSITITTEWKLFTEKFTPTVHSGGVIRFYVFCGSSTAPDTTSWLELRDVVLEETPIPADLTGTDGQVMVEIPQHYRKFETVGNIKRCLMSQMPLTGYHLVPKMYVSAYEASLNRVTNKLSSVVNMSADYRGGNNTTAWDNTYRSLLGMPASKIDLTDFRTYARNRGAYGLNGAGWNAYTYDAHKAIYWLYLVEYANRNCQLAFNPQPDVNGFKQGGLGEGVTTLNSTTWESYNSSNPIILCGYTNGLGNFTGTVDYTLPTEYGTLTVKVPSYRGIENPFGHINKFTEGVMLFLQAEDKGGEHSMYVTNDPTKFNSVSITGLYKIGIISKSGGYIREIDATNGDLRVINSGGSSNTYFADLYSSFGNRVTDSTYFYEIGGSCANGLSGGMLRLSQTGLNVIGAEKGTRLTFIPN